MSREVRNKPMTLLLYEDDGIWSDPDLEKFDARRSAIVEANDRALQSRLPGGDVGENETVSVSIPDPQHVLVAATLDKPGIVVLADVFYPGWKLEIDGKPAEILRTNRMMRGAFVQAGKHTLTYYYDPDSFRFGKWLSLAGLGILVVSCGTIALLEGLKRRRSQDSRTPRNAAADRSQT